MRSVAMSEDNTNSQELFPTIHTDLERLQLSGVVVLGEGHQLFAGDQPVGFYLPTEDGRHHVFDVCGRRLGNFATKENAMSFVTRRWPLAKSAAAA